MIRTMIRTMIGMGVLTVGENLLGKGEPEHVVLAKGAVGAAGAVAQDGAVAGCVRVRSLRLWLALVALDPGQDQLLVDQ